MDFFLSFCQGFLQRSRLRFCDSFLQRFLPGFFCEFFKHFSRGTFSDYPAWSVFIHWSVPGFLQGFLLRFLKVFLHNSFIDPSLFLCFRGFFHLFFQSLLWKIIPVFVRDFSPDYFYHSIRVPSNDASRNSLVDFSRVFFFFRDFFRDFLRDSSQDLFLLFFWNSYRDFFFGMYPGAPTLIFLKIPPGIRFFFIFINVYLNINKTNSTL